MKKQVIKFLKKIANKGIKWSPILSIGGFGMAVGTDYEFMGWGMVLIGISVWFLPPFRI